MSIPHLLEYLPSGETLLKQAAKETKEEPRWKRNAKIGLSGLGGMALGTGLGAAGAHLADHLAGGIHPAKLQMALPVLGGLAGITYALHQANQQGEMTRGSKDPPKST